MAINIQLVTLISFFFNEIKTKQKNLNLNFDQKNIIVGK